MHYPHYHVHTRKQIMLPLFIIGCCKTLFISVCRLFSRKPCYVSKFAQQCKLFSRKQNIQPEIAATKTVLSSCSDGRGECSLQFQPKARRSHCIIIIASCLLPNDIISCFLSDYILANCFFSSINQLPTRPPPFLLNKNTIINISVAGGPVKKERGSLS